MALFGWYGVHRGQYLDQDGGGGGAATAAHPATGGGESAAPASAPSGGEGVIFEPAVGGEELPFEQAKAQLQEYTKKQTERQLGERADRAAGKKGKTDGDRVMPVQTPGPRRGPDGKFAARTPAPEAPASSVVNKPGATPGQVMPSGAPSGVPQLHPTNGTAAAQPASTAAAAAPATNGFTDQHLAIAAQLRMSKAQLESFGSAGNFEGWLHHMRQMAAQANPQQRPQAQAQPQWQSVQLPDGRTAYVQGGNPAGGMNTTAPSSASYSTPAGSQINPQQLHDLLSPITLDEADRADLHPALLKVVDYHNAVAGRLHQQLAQLEQFMPQAQALQQMAGQFQQLQQVEQRRQQTEMERQYEDAFGKVDKDLFGEGHFSKVEANQQNARARVAVEVTSRQRELLSRGEALPPVQTLVEQVRAMIWPDRLRNEALTKAAAASKQLRGAAVAVPTSREPAEPGERERAMAVIRDFYRQNPE